MDIYELLETLGDLVTLIESGYEDDGRDLEEKEQERFDYVVSVVDEIKEKINDDFIDYPEDLSEDEYYDLEERYTTATRKIEAWINYNNWKYEN